MCESPPPAPRKVTRRSFATLLAGSAVTGLLDDAIAEGQEKPMESVPDSRPARLEKARGVPFTEAQAKALPAQLKDVDDTGEALRKFALQDGGSEPGIVFHPVPPGKAGGKQA